MATSADIFAYVTGIISLLALVGSVLRTFLPSVRMRVLDEILEDTGKTLRSAAEEGIFREQVFIIKAQRRLSALRKECSRLRVRTVCATSPLQEYQELCRGLSASIGYYTEQAKELRAHVVSTSEAERQRMYGEDDTLRSQSRSIDPPIVSTAREENACVFQVACRASIGPQHSFPKEQDTRVIGRVLIRPISCPPRIHTTGWSDPAPSYKEDMLSTDAILVLPDSFIDHDLVRSRPEYIGNDMPSYCGDGSDASLSSFTRPDTYFTGFHY